MLISIQQNFKKITCIVIQNHEYEIKLFRVFKKKIKILENIFLKYNFKYKKS